MPWIIAFATITSAVALTALVLATLFASLPRYLEDAERLVKATRELNALSAERLRLQRETGERCEANTRQLEALFKGYERFQGLRAISSAPRTRQELLAAELTHCRCSRPNGVCVCDFP